MRWSRGSTILFLLVAGGLSVATFSVKYQVQSLDDELNALNRQIEADRRAIHVLEAEWSHLNDPRRLRKLAEEYLGLAPVTAENLGDFESLPKRDYRQRTLTDPTEGLARGASTPASISASTNSSQADRKEVRNDD